MIKPPQPVKSKYINLCRFTVSLLSLAFVLPKSTAKEAKSIKPSRVSQLSRHAVRQVRPFTLTILTLFLKKKINVFRMSFPFTTV
ncbi:hypothetical protein WN943_003013 [Citrus x changshan-huyou]